MLFSLILPNTSVAKKGCFDTYFFEPTREIQVQFKGDYASENAVKLFVILLDDHALPCVKVQVPDESADVRSFLEEERILPLHYPSPMDSVLCDLNQNRCKGGQLSFQSGEELTVPRAVFTTFAYIDEIEVLDGERVPDDVLKRLGLPKAEWSPKEEREFLEALKLRNLGFKKSAIKRMYVPRDGYMVTITLPERALQNSELYKLFSEKTVSWMTPNAFKNVRAFSEMTFESIENGWKDAKKIVSYRNGVDTADKPLIVVADKGIDTDSIYFHELAPSTGIYKSVSPSETDMRAAFNLNSKCSREKSHGTHVTGIILAQAGTVYNGVAPKADLMWWQFDHTKANFRASRYNEHFGTFIQHNDARKVKIVNLSVDFPEMQAKEDREAFGDLVTNTVSVLWVAAAGNGREGQPGEELKSSSLTVPLTEYAKPNVITVAALNSKGDALLHSSNRNAPKQNVVHIAAPGEEIISICAENNLGSMSGTSQAAAWVTGAAALLAENGLDDPWAIKLRLMYTADFLPSLLSVVTSGRLNIDRALDVHVDKICPQQFTQYDSYYTCSIDQGTGTTHWSHGLVTFGVLDANGAPITPVYKVDITHKNGTEEDVHTGRILRIYGKGNTRKVLLYDVGKEQKFHLLHEVRSIKATRPEFVDKPIVLQQPGIFPRRLAEIGDFVRRIPD
jgi:hypothetical protein